MRRPPHSPQPSKSPSRVDFLDMVSFREAADAIAVGAGEERVQPEFPALKEAITGIRLDPTWREDGWLPAQVQIALASIDTRSEGQLRVVDALGRNFSVDVSNYRENFVSVPPGRQLAELFDRERGQRPLVSVASRLAYTIGRLSCQEEPQLLVVSHAFELFYPLSHLARANPRARVGLAFFSSLLDQRWKHAGLLDGESGIRFFDLDLLAGRIFGGIELSDRRPAAAPRNAGLDLI